MKGQARLFAPAKLDPQSRGRFSKGFTWLIAVPSPSSLFPPDLEVWGRVHEVQFGTNKRRCNSHYDFQTAERHRLARLRNAKTCGKAPGRARASDSYLAAAV